MTREEKRLRNRRALKLLLAVFVVAGIIDAVTGPKPLPVRPPDPQTLREQQALKDPCDELTANQSLVQGARQRIIDSGYDCQTLDLICPPVRYRGQRDPDRYDGFAVSCNQHRYIFDLENYGGKWLVYVR